MACHLNARLIASAFAFLLVSGFPGTAAETLAPSDERNPANSIANAAFVDSPGVQEGGVSRISFPYWQFSAGTLAGKKPGEEAKGFPSFMLVTSYHFPVRLSAGVGVGLDIMDYMVAPLYADLKFLPATDRSYRLYLYMQAGHSFPIDKTSELWAATHRNSGGIFLGTGAGILFPGREDFRLFIQAGFRYNELGIDITNNWANTRSRIINQYNRLELRIGIYFS
jgi:hypothetical protein